MVKPFASSVWQENPCGPNTVASAINVLPEATSRSSGKFSWGCNNLAFLVTVLGSGTAVSQPPLST